MELFGRMSEYIDLELDAATRDRIARHIHDCCHCNACYETLKQTVAICRDASDDYPLPENMTTKLMDLIRQASK
jgi:anti-sigma factor RsiW